MESDLVNPSTPADALDLGHPLGGGGRQLPGAAVALRGILGHGLGADRIPHLCPSRHL